MRSVAPFLLALGCIPGTKSATDPTSSPPDGTVPDPGDPTETRHSGHPLTHSADPGHTGSSTGGPPAQGLLVPPAAVAGESVVCYVLEEQSYNLRLYAVGMDTGTIVEHSRWGATTSSYLPAGIAYDGAHLLTGGETSVVWYHFDLAAGTKTVGPPSGINGANNGVAFYDDGAMRGFLTLDPWTGRMELFASAADVVAGAASIASIPGLSGFTRFTTDGPTLYGAWHSTDEVLVYDVPTRNQTGTIALQNWNTWVWGMSVVAGELYLIDDGRGLPGQTHPRIGVFDLAGNNVANVSVTGHRFAKGLVCLAP